MGARHGRPVLSHDRACEAVLRVADISRSVAGQSSAIYRALGTSVAVPCAVLHDPDTPCCGQRRSESRHCDAALARQSTEALRSRRATCGAGPGALRSQDRDLFLLRKGQVAEPIGAPSFLGGMRTPPPRNQRPPTGGDTPHDRTAASSLDSGPPGDRPSRTVAAPHAPPTGGIDQAIASQAEIARSDLLRFRFCIAAPHHRGVATDQLNSPCTYGSVCASGRSSVVPTRTDRLRTSGPARGSRRVVGEFVRREKADVRVRARRSGCGAEKGSLSVAGTAYRPVGTRAFSASRAEPGGTGVIEPRDYGT